MKSLKLVRDIAIHLVFPGWNRPMGFAAEKLVYAKRLVYNRYMAGIRVNEKEPHGGCLCVSCETEMQWISINGFLIGHFCQNDDCVRYGLLCQAWKEKLPYVEAAAIEA